MLFKNITILDDNLEIKESMYVGIKGDKIDYIDTEMPDKDYGTVYEGRNKLLMSGFFNAHAHTPMTLMRGYGENMKLLDWLNQRIFPFESHLTKDAVYYGTLLGIAESLRYGIVSMSDMYYFCDRMAEAVLESGVKNNISRGITCFTDDELKDLPSYYESMELYKQYHGAGDGRIKVDLSLHAEYTTTPKISHQLGEMAKELGINMHVHISESQEEHEECKQRHEGKTPVAYFNDLGVFDSPTIAAHCIWLEGEDFDILADKGVTVATCPISNLKLASGVCNVPYLLKKGINVAIGTDSVSSNNSLNFIEELKVFALIHKERQGDPTLITPKQAIIAGTRAGALAQGRYDTGKLKVGNKADLIVIDLSGPNMYPVFDMRNNLIYSASGSDVSLTMVDGKLLYQDGEYMTIDIEKVKYQAGKHVGDILKQLKQM